MICVLIYAFAFKRSLTDWQHIIVGPAKGLSSWWSCCCVGLVSGLRVEDQHITGTAGASQHDVEHDVRRPHWCLRRRRRRLVLLALRIVIRLSSVVRVACVPCLHTPFHCVNVCRCENVFRFCLFCVEFFSAVLHVCFVSSWPIKWRWWYRQCDNYNLK